MCRKLLLLLLVLGFVGSVQAALVHEWEFDNNVSDTSGSGNHGTVTGTTSYVSPVDDWNGGTGKAFHLDEATHVRDMAPVNLPIAMTGAYAIRGPSFAHNVYVKAAAGNTFDSWDSIAGWGDNVNNGDRAFHSRGTTNVFHRGYTHDAQGSVTWTDNTWHMLTFSYDQTGYPTFYGDETMWIDGVVVHSNDNRHWGDIPDPDIWVGLSTGIAGADYWEGDVDCYQIWNSGLDQAAVDTLYERIPEPATIALLGLGGLALLRRRR